MNNNIITKYNINIYFRKYLNYKNNNLIKNNYIYSLNIKYKNILNNINLIKLTANQKIENIKLIAEKDIKKNKNDILEKIFIDLLPIIDNLERTININIDNINNNSLIIEGINLILLDFKKFISKFKLEVIENIQVIFNPKIHQAISIINDLNIPNNYIVNIFQKGYIFNNKLLRPAMVTVNKLNNLN